MEAEATVWITLRTETYVNAIVAGLVSRGYGVVAADSSGKLAEASGHGVILGLAITQGDHPRPPVEIDDLEDEIDPEAEQEFAEIAIDLVKVVAYGVGETPLSIVAVDNVAESHFWSVCRPKQQVGSTVYDRLRRDE